MRARRDLIVCILSLAVVLPLGVGAFGKLADIGSFEHSLLSWGVPVRVLAFVALLVPAVELLIACAWIVSPARRLAILWCAVAALSGATVYYAYRHLLDRPPQCACFGVWSRYLQITHDAFDVYARNGVMLVCGVLAIGLAAPRAAQARPGRSDTPASRELHTARGFTLVETLVCVAVLAVLIALVAGSLARVRSEGRKAKSLSNQRQHVAVFTMYTGDWRETWPIFWAHGLWRTIPTEPYFAMGDVWPREMIAAGYYRNSGLDPFVSPDAPAESHVLPDGTIVLPGRDSSAAAYRYACVFLADPLFWSVETRVGPSQWRATRLSEVVYPAEKALLSSYFPWILAERGILRGEASVDIGFVEGSAARLRSSTLTTNPVSGDGPRWIDFGAMHATDLPPGTHTLLGVRGRDVLGR